MLFRSRPRWERRKDARPAELTAAALQLFIEKGYAGTRLEDVASRAGVSKGTLYLYFDNKEHLFKAVVRDNVVARISRSAGELLRFGGSSADLLSSLITRWWHDYGSSEAGGLGKLVMVVLVTAGAVGVQELVKQLGMRQRHRPEHHGLTRRSRHQMVPPIVMLGPVLAWTLVAASANA